MGGNHHAMVGNFAHASVQPRHQEVDMKNALIGLVLLGIVCATGLPGAGQVTAPRPRPLIQLAILLDTSNSMDGLIAQAKTQLWKVVNEMAKAKRDGASPRLEVALYEYGKDSLPRGEGFVRQIVPLSEDLDRISEELFKLTTNGGDEYCGEVITKAANALQWSASAADYKVIFIAGNEPFTQQGQARYNYREACKLAISRGITVNTIFCGNYAEGVSGMWKDGADLADGRYMNIDQDQKTVYIPAPQDDEIARLGTDLNKTYIAYGQKGGESKSRQAAQDTNAAAASPEANVQRVAAKAAPMYNNSSWDLVDAAKAGKKVEEVAPAELPAEMQKMTPAERAQYVQQMQQKRAEIQKKIGTLQKERERFVADKQKQAGQATGLDQAMVKALREQAAKKNFVFEK
jgi:hypothetical protein